MPKVMIEFETKMNYTEVMEALMFFTPSGSVKIQFENDKTAPSVTRTHVRHHGQPKPHDDDPRAVYIHNHACQRVLDVDATLNNMNLTYAQISAMKTKRGTLENSVKSSFKQRNRYAA